jgi:hypothetical protein
VSQTSEASKGRRVGLASVLGIDGSLREGWSPDIAMQIRAIGRREFYVDRYVSINCMLEG